MTAPLDLEALRAALDAINGGKGTCEFEGDMVTAERLDDAHYTVELALAEHDAQPAPAPVQVCPQCKDAGMMMIGDAQGLCWCAAGDKEREARGLPPIAHPPAHAADGVPTIGSRWQHKNGNFYTVLTVANTDSTRHDEYPLTVIYQGDNGKVWNRRAADWHRSMTLVTAADGAGELERARHIVANLYHDARDHDYAAWVLEGKKDDTLEVRAAIAALRQPVPDAVRELAAQWRRRAHITSGGWRRVVLNDCADELESALASQQESRND